MRRILVSSAMQRQHIPDCSNNRGSAWYRRTCIDNAYVGIAAITVTMALKGKIRALREREGKSISEIHPPLHGHCEDPYPGTRASTADRHRRPRQGGLQPSQRLDLSTDGCPHDSLPPLVKVQSARVVRIRSAPTPLLPALDAPARGYLPPLAFAASTALTILK